jgi:peptidyl-prolyl cis-trans isomerase SurA
MRTCLSLLLALATTACSGSPSSPSAPAPAPAPAAPTPAPAAAPTPAPVPAAAPAAAADPDEACAQIIVVSYKGAAHAQPSVTRDQAAAERRARELLETVRGAADFGQVAAQNSDAPSSAARGGNIGTFQKGDWPQLHQALRDPVFGLKVGEVAPAPVAADYGYVIVRRCAVEKARSRHILVRYRGAKNAGPEIKRSKPEAEARARELLAKLAAGADFAELARSSSDDSSAERGGDVGSRGRGVLAPAYEKALFGMQPGQRSDLVESEFGYHIIERLPDTP